MSTEQPLTTVGDTDVNQPATENQTATDNSTTQTEAPSGDASSSTPEVAAAPAPEGAAASVPGVAAAPAPEVKEPRDDDEESRPAGEDFGQLLDQFEQEQSTLQEGEVVRGTVVGITERGVVIDFGYKSEGIVNQNE